MIAEQALQQRADLRDDGVQVERPRIQHLAAAEREQLLRQLGGAVGSTFDLTEIAAELDVVVRPLEKKRGVAGDAGEQVVEVVGDAPRKPSQALELLGVQQLHLEPLPLGDVAKERDVQAGEEVRSGEAVRDLGCAVDLQRVPLGADRPALQELRPVLVHRRELVRGQELVDASGRSGRASRRRSTRMPRD